jgi:osmotically-inducible protein OsmY
MIAVTDIRRSEDFLIHSIDIRKGNDMKRHQIIMVLSASVFAVAAAQTVYAQSSAADAQMERVNFADDSRPAVDDTMLTSKVKAALSSDPAISALKINVSAKQGIVFVTGMVPNADVRERLVQLVAGVEGVRSVKNELTVTTGY